MAALITLMPGLHLAGADTATVYGQADAVWDAQISPDGRRVALGCAPTGVKAVCIYDLVEGGPPEVVYPGPELRIEWYYWASDDYLVTNVAKWETIRTSAGLESYTARRAFSYSLKTDKYAMLMRDQGNWDNLTRLTATCDADPRMVIMSLTARATDGTFGTRNQRNGMGFRTDDFEVNLKTGKTKKRKSRPASVVETILGSDCEPIVDVIYNDQRKEFAIDLKEGRKRLFQQDNADIVPMDIVGLTIDKSGLIVRADFGDAYGMHTLSLDDGTMTPITYDGAELGRMGVVRDVYSDTVIGFTGTDDIQEHLYIDETLIDLQNLVEGALPGQSARILSFDRNRSMFTIEAEAPGIPRTFYLFDAAARELSPLGSVAPQIDGALAASVEAIQYESRDGLVIPGYLTLPLGKTRADGPFPTVLMPHGGPEARDTARFDWWSQAYAAAGYAVIQPNFRGSAGYGQAFRDAGFGEFGGRMVDDVVDAIAWAEAEGLTGPEGVCVAGASYGGYSALMTALKAPSKVGCVVAVAPVTNIYNHMGRFERSSEPYRYWARYAGSDVFDERETQVSITPELRAGEYAVPVMLIHGKADYTVEFQQSQRFRNRWGSRPGLTFVEMEGEDHYLTSTTARYTVLSESLRHLDAHHPAR